MTPASSVIEVLRFVLLIAFAAAALEGYLYLHFHEHRRPWFLPATAAAAALLAALHSSQAALAAGLLQACSAFFFQRVVRGRHALPFMLLAPGALGLALLVAYPLGFEVYLAFTDLKLTTVMRWSRTGEIPFAGFKHFVKVFTSSPLSEVSFWRLLLRTALWTFVNVSCHVAGGFALALLLHRKLRLKGLYRTLLVIPWAMPQVVAVLAWKGEFHSQFGFVNAALGRLGLWPVEWLTRHAFLTCCLVNVWLGIPFMMVIILGGLQSISQHYYDAAAIDGASAFQQFRAITLPLIKPVLAPAVTLGTVWTFNNINVIYLLTGQAGGIEDADILVSALYKAAFTYYRYSFSAAFAIVIFAFLFAFAMAWLKWTRAAESAYDQG
jgi:arabinogalactan oligomer/maltooligosaccharide transport system permease protein